MAKTFTPIFTTNVLSYVYRRNYKASCVMENILSIESSDVEKRIISVRGQNVLLDRDVAELYGVEAREVNQAIKNNPEKFPEGYVFELQLIEKQELIKNFDRFERLKHSTVLPRAFTEKGLYMLATILKSKKATETTLAIIESFTKLREISGNLQRLEAETDRDKQQALAQKTGELINDIFVTRGKTTETESSIELNFLAVKLKHTVKRKAEDE